MRGNRADGDRHLTIGTGFIVLSLVSGILFLTNNVSVAILREREKEQRQLTAGDPPAIPGLPAEACIRLATRQRLLRMLLWQGCRLSAAITVLLAVTNLSHSPLQTWNGILVALGLYCIIVFFRIIRSGTTLVVFTRDPDPPSSLAPSAVDTKSHD